MYYLGLCECENVRAPPRPLSLLSPAGEPLSKEPSLFLILNLRRVVGALLGYNYEKSEALAPRVLLWRVTSARCGGRCVVA